MRSRPSGFSLVTTRPLFLSDPAIAPRTLWDCQPRDLPSCSIVAPAGWRSIDSNRAILLVLGFAAFLGPVFGVPPTVVFVLVIVHSIASRPPAVAGPVAIAS